MRMCTIVMRLEIFYLFYYKNKSEFSTNTRMIQMMKLVVKFFVPSHSRKKSFNFVFTFIKNLIFFPLSLKFNFLTFSLSKKFQYLFHLKKLKLDPA